MNNYNWEDKTIIIAEDIETSKQYFSAALRRTNIKILWARTGLEAIEINKQNEIDLILMDLDLPVMNGLIAAKLIRETHPDLPIIAQTAHVQNTDNAESNNAGCNAFLTKPIALNVLLSTLARYL
ncbi:MAG: response regulator [Bacteroidales bacterium]|jgi:CheY-like chemotaxis protein|nr:response regulator [Bacteroidales bacterium]